MVPFFFFFSTSVLLRAKSPEKEFHVQGSTVRHRGTNLTDATPRVVVRGRRFLPAGFGTLAGSDLIRDPSQRPVSEKGGFLKWNTR